MKREKNQILQKTFTSLAATSNSFYILIFLAEFLQNFFIFAIYMTKSSSTFLAIYGALKTTKLASHHLGLNHPRPQSFKTSTSNLQLCYSV